MSGDSGHLAKRRRIETIDSSDEEKEEECFIHRLPDEILVDIFKWLFFKERQQCAAVCKRWFSIVRSRLFMIRTKVEMNHAFGMLIDMPAQRLLSNCGHIDFNDCASTPGLLRGNLIPAIKAEDTPGPSTARPGISIEDFLFSGMLPVRSLIVSATYLRILEYVRGRLSSMKDLEEFHMNILPVRDNETGLTIEQPVIEWSELTEPLWTIKHDNLRSLKVFLYASPMSYALELPRLRTFIGEIDSDNELQVLIKYSKQLEELGLLFYFPRAMEQTLTYPFPQLKKLRLRRYGPNESPDPNTRVDDASAERFINSAPLLDDVTLNGNIIMLKIFRAVCLKGAESITRLTLSDVAFQRNLFVFILELKKLQFLKLKQCLLEDGSPLREVDFPMLRQLILINSGTCMRIDSGLSNVTRFKYTIDPKLSKVCRHMTLLEDFEIKLRTKYPVAGYVKDHIHSLPMLDQLRTLRLSGIKTNNRPWPFCKPMPSVEHLVLRKSNLVRVDFSMLPKLFPSLRMLELDETCIAYKRCPAGVKPLAHFRGRLKQFFPTCNVTLNPQCVALPLATVLEMEDEYRWNLKQAREAGLTIEHISAKQKTKAEAKAAARQQRDRERRLKEEAGEGQDE